MSQVLRSTTFQLQFNGNDGITGVRTFSKEIRDTDAFVKDLNKTLGDSATVVAKNTKSKAELTREARNFANQTARNETRVEKITQHYAHMASTVGRTADEIEVLNAVQSLGSNATKQQQEQVANAVKEYQRLRGPIDSASGSMRNFRGVMQNAGWQLQDTLVQLQMGTDGFVVFSQQGSQMASAFGPKGAVIGALIAVAGVVGGTLFKSLQSATEKTKELDKANKALNEYLTLNAEGATELSSKFEELARTSELVANTQLSIARADAFTAQKESIKLVKQEMDGFNNILATSLNNAKAINAPVKNVVSELGRLKTKNLVDMNNAFEMMNKDVTAASIERFLGYLNDIEPSGKKATKEINALRKTLVDQYASMVNNEKILKDTENGWKGLSKEQRDASNELVKNFEREAKSLVNQTQTLEDEYKKRRQVILDFVASGEDSEYDAVQSFKRLHEWYTKEKKKLEEKQAKDKITEVDRAFDREFNRVIKQTESIDEQYDRRHAIITAYTEQVDHDAERAAIAFDALEQWKTDAITKEYQKRERVRQRIENAQLQTRGFNDPLGAETSLFIRNMKTLGDQASQLGEEQLTERQRINSLIEGEVARHVTAMQKAEVQSYQNQVAIFAMASQQMTQLADIMSNGTADIEAQVAEMNEFQKAMFIVSQTVAAAQALVSGMSLGIQLAEMFPLAAPAMVAFGTGLGAATAGAIAGTTIAGAFDNGGYIPAGQIGAVAGYGDEFVNGTLVRGPAKVTSRKNTAELLRDSAGSGNNVNLSVQVENRIEGGQYRVEQISEDRIKIIAEQVFSRNIDDGVSQVIDNPNSKTAKSYRKNYKTERRL